jgi:hypothetical protein
VDKRVLCLLLLAACKSPEQKLADAHGPKIAATLKSIAALSPLVEKQPALPAPRWPIAGAKVGTNTGVVWSNQLTDPCTHWYTTYAPDNGGNDFIHIKQDQSEYWLTKPACAVAGNKDKMGGFRQDDVDTLLGMKYVLVLHPTQKKAPRIDAGEASASVDEYLKTGKGKNVEHFSSGRIAGDALLYELATAKLVGGFPFDASSSDTVKTKTDFKELVFDLNEQLETQLDATLRK